MHDYSVRWPGKPGLKRAKKQLFVGTAKGKPKANELMEDEAIVEKTENQLFIGVFDGHAGQQCAKDAKSMVSQKLVSHLNCNEGEV